MKQNKKRLSAALSLVICLIMAVQLLSAAVMADDIQPMASVPFVGSGTEADPYLIQDETDLAALAEYINSGRGAGIRKYYQQVNDIDLSSVGTWTPIGKESLVFQGVYHGDGHKITGMHAEGTTYVGLFGRIAEAELYDIYVQGDITVTAGSGLSGYRAIGGLVGCAGRSISIDSETPRTIIIQGCTSDVQITSSKTGNGGIAGQVDNHISIVGCMNKGNLILSESGNFYAGGGSGGIVGYFAADGSIDGCVNTGSIINTGSGDNSMGGILGAAHTAADVTISNCYNTGSIATAGTYTSVGAGGIIGSRTNWFDKNNTVSDPYDVRIFNCYNIGSVSAANKGACAGGIAGRVLQADSYGEPVVTDDNTAYVYSLDKASDRLITDEYNKEIAAALTDVSYFTESLSTKEGIPWVLKKLGSRFKEDKNFVNNGFPLLYWQDEGEPVADGSGRAAFDITYDNKVNISQDRTAKIAVDGELIDGFSCVASEGTHTFTVNLDGYQPYEGTFTISSGSGSLITVPVNLTAVSYTWKLSLTPAAADLLVEDSDGDTVLPISADGGIYTFSVYNGQYTYKASADGYYDAAGSFRVNFRDGSRDISLEIIPETAPKEPSVSEDGYYLIYTPQELEWINQQATSVSSESAAAMAAACIRLMADIDMDGYPWLPMSGTENAAYLGNGYYSGGCYTGVFDGNGHRIYNLTMDRENTAESSYVFSRADGVGGLFGWTKGALIKDLGIEGSIHVSDAPASGYGDFLHVGGIVGMAQSVTGIVRCYSKMDITVDVTRNEQGKLVGYYYASDTYIGGIAGSLTTGSAVEDCYSSGAITGSETLSVNIGGIAGSTRGDYHVYDEGTNELIETIHDRIVRSYSNVSITSDPYSSGYLGGIVGLVRGGTLGEIPEIYENYALNPLINGSDKCIANRILGNSYSFEQSGYYNYALEDMIISGAALQETESNYANSYGLDVSDARARQAETYSNIGWSSEVWKLDVVGEYPHLWFEEDFANHDHQWEAVEVIPSDCFNYGYTVYRCSVCGEEITGSFTNPGAHQWGEWTVSSERANSHEHTCTLCGTKEIKLHTWDEGTVIDGVMTYTCTVCGEVKGGAASGWHIHISDYTDGDESADRVSNIDPEKLYKGQTDLVINCDRACVVAMEQEDGTFTRLYGTKNENGFTVSLNVTSDIHIAVALKGDSDLNGLVKSKDATVIVKYLQGTYELDPIKELAADADANGNVKSKDATVIVKMISGTYTTVWDE